MLTSTKTLGTTRYFFIDVVEEDIDDTSDIIDQVFHEDMYQFSADMDVSTPNYQRYF